MPFAVKSNFFQNIQIPLPLQLKKNKNIFLRPSGKIWPALGQNISLPDLKMS